MLLGSGIYSYFSSLSKNHELVTLQNQLTEQNQLNNSVVADLQNQNLSTETKYQDLKGVLNATKVTNVPCTLTADAVKLWNKSSGVKTSVSTNTSRVIETNPLPSRVEGIGIEIALQSKLDSDKILSDARNNQQAIIDWNNKTYGK